MDGASLANARQTVRQRRFVLAMVVFRVPARPSGSQRSASCRRTVHCKVDAFYVVAKDAHRMEGFNVRVPHIVGKLL